MEKIEEIKKITQELLGVLELDVKIEVKETEGIINIQLESQEPGILIGYHGETLYSLQH